MDWLLSHCLVILVLAKQCAGICPSVCDCEAGVGGHVINCRYKSLTDVPAFTASSQRYSEITLAHNSIQRIEAMALSGMLVEKLDLSENQILYISPMAFNGVENELRHLILQIHSRNYDLTLSFLKRLTRLKTLDLRGFNGTIVHHESFLPFTELTTLHLTDCNIRGFSSGVFKNQAVKLTELKVEKNNLTSIPTSELRQLTKLGVLSLADNNIHATSRDDFATLTVLGELDLNTNGLTSVGEGAFNGLENELHSLQLYGNSITDIKEIRNLVKLQQLILQKNNIATIPAGIFINLKLLDTINMNDNKLRTIAATTFAGLEDSLEILMLDKNHVTRIDAGAFSSFSKLADILLDEQFDGLANVITDETFQGLEGVLKVLSLQKNQLTSANLNAIGDLTRLRSLDLCFNTIDSIPDFLFANKPNMRTLKLCDAGLTTINQKSLYGMQNLVTLEIEGNSLQTLDRCLFYDFKMDHAMNLNLARNKFNCDCRLKWFRQWIDSRYPPDNNGNYPFEAQALLPKWKCATPAKHQNKAMHTISADQFTCVTHTQEPSCEPYTTVAPPTTTVPSIRGITLDGNTTKTEVTVTWTVVFIAGVTSWRVSHYESEKSTSEAISSTPQSPTSRSYAVTGLKRGTNYNVCLYPITNTGEEHPLCREFKTLSENGGGNTGSVSDGNNGEVDHTATIVGATVGSIAAVVIISVAVIFYLHRRKKVVQKAKQNREIQEVAVINVPGAGGGIVGIDIGRVGPTASFDSKAYMYNIDNKPDDSHIPSSPTSGANSFHGELQLQYSPTDDGKVQNNINSRLSNEERHKRISDKYKDIPLPEVPRKTTTLSPNEGAYDVPDDAHLGAVGGREEASVDGYLNPACMTPYEGSSDNNNDKSTDPTPNDTQVEQFI